MLNRTTRRCGALLLALLAGSLMAEDAHAPQTRANASPEVAAATVQTVTALHTLRSALIGAGDADGAAAIERMTQEIEAGRPMSVRARSTVTVAALANKAKTLVGVYITQGGSAVTLHILASTRCGGTYSSALPGWSPEGSWTVIDESTVKMIRPDGSEWLFDIDGVSLRSRIDHSVWSRQQ
jgi:hypothetical protein